MEYREIGRDALSQYITKKPNVEIMEKTVYATAVRSIPEQGADEDLLVEKYNDILYQVIGDIISGVGLREILSSLKQDKVYWNHPSYDDLEMMLKEQDNFAENPIEIVEGVETCRKCGSNRVFSYSVQVRSADEGYTTFCNCTKCGANWRHN